MLIKHCPLSEWASTLCTQEIATHSQCCFVNAMHISLDHFGVYSAVHDFSLWWKRNFHLQSRQLAASVYDYVWPWEVLNCNLITYTICFLRERERVAPNVRIAKYVVWNSKRRYTTSEPVNNYQFCFLHLIESSFCHQLKLSPYFLQFMNKIFL